MTPAVAPAAGAPARPAAARGLCVGALLGALLVQQDFLGSARATLVPAVWGAAALIGLLAWKWTARRVPDPPPAEPSPPARPTPRRSGVFAVMLVASLLSVGLGLACLHGDLSSPVGAWLWALGLAVYALAWTVREGAGRNTAGGTARRRVPRLAVLAVVVMALGVRLYRLADIPPTFLQDEAAVAEWGLNWLHGAPVRGQAVAMPVPLFRNGTTAYPLPGSVLQALVMQVAGETVFGARLTAALAGGLTVWVLLELLSEFTAPWAALAGALLLAVNHVDLYWTRSGMLQSLTTLLATAVMWQTLRGLRSARQRPFVLGGLALGAAQYLYEGARFLVPILAVFFVHQAITVRGFVRTYGARIAHMAVIAALVFAPIGFWYWQHPNELLMRTRAVAVFSSPGYLASRYAGLDTVHVVLAQWQKSLLGFAFTGDGSSAFYDLRAPMVDPVTGALVLFAILGVTLRPRPLRLRLVLWWFWIPVAIACTITIDPPPMTRLCLTIPAWAAIAAFAFDRLGHVFRATSRVGRLVFAVAVIGAIAYAGLWNLRAFFDRYPHTLPANGWTVIGQFVREKGPAFKSYMVSPMDLYAGAPEMRFWARTLAMDDLAADAIPVHERGYRHGLFLVAPRLEPALTKLRATYPTGVLHEHRDARGRLLFTSYEVDADALNAAAGPDAPWRQADARFGQAGSGRGQFREGHGLAVGANGMIAVADTGNQRVVLFDRDGTPLGELPRAGTAAAAFQDLAAVAIDASGRVLALDRDRHLITRYRTDGTLDARLVLTDVSDPVALAIAPDGSLLVADRDQGDVVRLDNDGRVILRSGAARHSKPVTALAVAGDGTVFVIEDAQRRVRRLPAGLESGVEWTLHTTATAFGSSIAVSDAGDAVYVIQRDTRTVARYTRDGRFTWAIEDVSGAERLLGPAAVATDGAGSVFVLDAVRNQVVRFDVTHPLAGR